MTKEYILVRRFQLFQDFDNKKQDDSKEVQIDLINKIDNNKKTN